MSFKDKLNNTWFYGIGAQNVAFETFKNYRFAVSKDIILGGSQSKAYTCFNDIEDIKNIFKEEENSPLYEVIRDDIPIRLFADLEWRYSWKKEKEIISHFTTLVKNTLEELKIQETGDFLFSSASKADKGSLHFVCTDIIFDNLNSQRNFWEHIYRKINTDNNFFFIDETLKSYIYKTYIDFSVYTKNRPMRMLYADKMKKDGSMCGRPLIPLVDGFDLEDYLIQNNHFENLISLKNENEITMAERFVYSKELINNFIDKNELDIEKLKNGNLLFLKNKKNVRKCPFNNEHDWKGGYIKFKSCGKACYHCSSDKCKTNELTIVDLRSVKASIDWNSILKSENIYEELNLYWGVVLTDTKPYYIVKRLVIDENNYPYITYSKYTKQGFLQLYENRSIVKDKKTIQIADKWLKYDKRTEYSSEVFDANNNDSRVLNFYTGFSISKERSYEGEMKAFLSHILVHYCENNEIYFNFLMDWFAHLIQKPLVKMSSCIVLQGEEGCGKGSLIQLISKIIGKRYFYHPSGDLLSSDFNGNLINKALIFLDECFSGYDKKVSGSLKKLLTEKTFEMNEKYMPKIVFENHFNVVMATNEEWCVPAGNSSRRFFILRVNNEARNNVDLIYNCNPHHLAHYLYNRDITDFKHDTCPITDALIDQKDLSDNVRTFWSCVYNGEIDEIEVGKFVSFEHVYRVYLSENYPTKKVDKRMFSIKTINLFGDIRTRQTILKQRKRGYNLPLEWVFS